MYRQGIADIDLFIEQDTPNTPEAKRFYVIHRGNIVDSYISLKAAAKRYKAIIQDVGYTPPPVEQTANNAIAQAAQDDLMSRKDLYWSASSAHRTTNKRRA